MVAQSYGQVTSPAQPIVSVSILLIFYALDGITYHALEEFDHILRWRVECPKKKITIIQRAGRKVIVNQMGTHISDEAFDKQRQAVFIAPPADGIYLLLVEIEAVEKLDPDRLDGSIAKLVEARGKKVILAGVDQGHPELWQEIIELFSTRLQKADIELESKTFKSRKEGVDWLFKAGEDS